MKTNYLTRLLLISTTAWLLTACQPATTDETSITGYVEAELRFVAAPQTGWIVAQDLKQGDLITANQLLFKLDDTRQLAEVEQAQQNLRATEAQLADLQKGARPEEVNALKSQQQEAQARLSFAQTEFKRFQTLLNKGLITAEQLDRAETDVAVNQAQLKTIQNNIKVADLGGRIDSLIRAEAQVRSTAAQLDSQQYQLSQRSLTANITGLVDEIYYHVGEYVNSGAPVLAIRLIDQDKVRFHVSQSQLHKLKLGQSISVQADGMDTSIPAKISYIASSAEFTPPVIYSKDSRAKLVFLIEAQLDVGYSLNPGLPVDISW